MTSQKKTTLERAFELADKGMMAKDIREMLSHEGYDQTQINGPLLTRQLNERARLARSKD
jgi:hypothetical protein